MTPESSDCCLHNSFHFFCSLCASEGYSLGDHDHGEHLAFQCKDCGQPWETAPHPNIVAPPYCQNCRPHWLKPSPSPFSSANTLSPYLCCNPNFFHAVCDACTVLYLPNEKSLLDRSLFTSLDDSFLMVFNTNEWALLCPICCEQGWYPETPLNMDHLTGVIQPWLALWDLHQEGGCVDSPTPFPSGVSKICIGARTAPLLHPLFCLEEALE